MTPQEPKSLIFRKPTKTTLADDIRVMLVLSFIIAGLAAGAGGAIAEAVSGMTATGRVVRDSTPTIASAVIMLTGALALSAIVIWKGYHAIKAWRSS